MKLHKRKPPKKTYLSSTYARKRVAPFKSECWARQAKRFVKNCLVREENVGRWPQIYGNKSTFVL